MSKDTLKQIIQEQREIIKNLKLIDRNISLETTANYILVGIRRAGKSWLLYKRVKDLIKSGVDWEQIIFINFDDERLKEFTSSNFNDILLVANELTKKNKYFYFDEIQNIDGWELFVRRLADQKYKVDIAGSNAKMLSSEMNAKLGGRYVCKEIMPFSFQEYLIAKKYNVHDITTQNQSLLYKYIDEYLKFGGFAECLNFINKREYISGIYQKVLLGDIMVHYGIRNKKAAELLFSKIAETVCSSVSYSRLHNTLSNIGCKLSKEILIDYCSYAQDAFLLFTLKNYLCAFVDKESKPKFYFMDNGILNLFINNKDSKLLENVVACHLYRKYKNELFYISSSTSGIEIDFYLANQKHLIQVCQELNAESRDREINALVKYASKTKEKHVYTIVTYSQKETIKKANITINVIPLSELLMNINE